MSTPHVPLRVGILGVGAIGRMLASALDRGRPGGCAGGHRGSGPRHARKNLWLAWRTRCRFSPLDELVQQSDLIVEAASQAALPEIVPKAIASGKDLLVLSVGGLLGHDEWFRQAAERGCRIHVPSGAIAGLDGLKSARAGRLDSVTLTSRKPIAALRGAKYVVEQGIDLESFKEDTVIFEGPPEEACRKFSRNLERGGVTAPGGRPGGERSSCAWSRRQAEAKTCTRSPRRESLGRLRVVIENVPSASNPRTSALAALSALATLDGITGSFRSAHRLGKPSANATSSAVGLGTRAW